ncbi:MAG: hypothetical protein JJE49_04130 [Peptostreptococcaceae bacterium]|nr:hypothetical protein [Peptostreptococcaceae bacterium]
MVNENLNKFKIIEMNFEKLKADCENCFGLCCAALYFSTINNYKMGDGNDLL